MNQQEVNRIAAWIEAAQRLQPEGTLAIFVYVRDGLINVGRGDVPIEMKAFPTDDLAGSADEPKVRELIYDALTKAFEAGPTDLEPDND